LCEGRTNDWQ
jgi:hypothetical protein